MSINSLGHHQWSWIILGLSTAIVVINIQVDGLSLVRSLDASNYEICGRSTHDAGRFIPAYCSGWDQLKTNHSRKTSHHHDINRIAGGRYASRGEFPSFARINIYFNGRIGSRCAGTIINKDTVLTAASCWTLLQQDLDAAGLRIEHSEVMVGDVDERYGNWQRIPIDKVCIHPFHVKYLAANTFDHIVYDVAMVLLEKDIEYNQYARPACIETGIAHREQATCYAVGMGRLSDGGVEDGRLKFVQMKRDCFYGPSGRQYEELERRIYGSTCYKSPEFGTSCFGDSGGPLICMEDCNGSGPQQFVVGPISSIIAFDDQGERVTPRCSSYDNLTANYISDVNRLGGDDGWNHMLECVGF